MLEPQSRTLVLDALRPPSGWRLDYAIGTTFSLDLLALLAAPLAFSFLDRTDREGRLCADPVSLLEALRRSVDRFSIFCQAGRIAVPRPDRLLLSYLERSVFEVSSPNGGVFHPKLWVLRLLDESESVHYRLVCATRNITFDRSWDTVLTLDGVLLARKNAIAANHPLADFVRALPGMARRTLPDAVAARIHTVQDELRRVDFELPEGLGDQPAYAFAPIGLTGRPESIFDGERIDRLLVVSPFVTDGFLDSVKQAKGNGILISRREELERLDPERLKAFGQIFAFEDDDAIENEDAETGEAATSTASPAEVPLSGLHAKLYVVESGWKAMLYTGSANATTAAFSGNVEFLAVLVGMRSKCGIDAILRETKGQASLKSFLEEFVPGDRKAEEDAVALELERRLEGVRAAIILANLQGTGVESQDGTWRASLRADPKEAIDPQAFAGVSVRTWPITCRSETLSAKVDLHARDGVWATIAALPFEVLTTFFAFEAALEIDNRRMVLRFVLNLPVSGLPADRHKRLLLKLLENREKVLAYLLLMLSDLEGDTEAPIDTDAGSGEGKWGLTANHEALFEALVRTLHRAPERLDDVAKLVNDLRSGESASDLLPEGFGSIWDPVWAVRRRIQDEKPAA